MALLPYTSCVTTQRGQRDRGRDRGDRGDRGDRPDRGDRGDRPDRAAPVATAPDSEQGGAPEVAEVEA
jgi:hypothetical protein